MCIFKVHNVSQWLNLRHLAEPLGGAVGLLEAVSFKEAEIMLHVGRMKHAPPLECRKLKTHFKCIINNNCYNS